jgi:hypothetical protein
MAAMRLLPNIREVFGRFQNLNLLFLMHDLRSGRTPRQAWRMGSDLCPVAHGMPHGQQVNELHALGQAEDLEDGCEFAAEILGADFDSLLRFVRSWDESILSTGALLRQLEDLWDERLVDAVTAQEFLLSATPSTLAGNPQPERKTAEIAEH